MTIQKSKNFLRQVGFYLHNFFVPAQINRQLLQKQTGKRIAVLIPTYCPTDQTYELITSILRWHPDALVVAIDDSTPLVTENLPSLEKIKRIAVYKRNCIYLRTPTNTLKAGALNYGIQYLEKLVKKPEIVFTFDDDVEINEHTLPAMIETLFSEETVGAVCSKALVKNKKANLLTRLQALEYHNFNITKTADNGFLLGPLVMQGMLSAFRYSALSQIKGFTNMHLIEDYDITARLKFAGWQVKMAGQALAWTLVPEKFEVLWKQRVRWTYGGIYIVRQFWKSVPIIFQDLIGHFLFLGLVALIAASFILKINEPENPTLIFILLTISAIHFVFGLLFNVITLLSYSNRDRLDWVIKLTLLPEFLYYTVLSLVLLGAYFFYLYNLIGLALVKRVKYLSTPFKWGLALFQKFGYSSTWGTRITN